MFCHMPYIHEYAFLKYASMEGILKKIMLINFFPGVITSLQK